MARVTLTFTDTPEGDHPVVIELDSDSEMSDPPTDAELMAAEIAKVLAVQVYLAGGDVVEAESGQPIPVQLIPEQDYGDTNPESDYGPLGF